jgi:hypothetical protein
MKKLLLAALIAAAPLLANASDINVNLLIRPDEV